MLTAPVNLSKNDLFGLSIPLEKFTAENKNFEYHTYLITVDDEFVPQLNSEHRGYAWTPLDDYPKPLHPGLFSTVNIDIVQTKLQTLTKKGP